MLDLREYRTPQSLIFQVFCISSVVLGTEIILLLVYTRYLIYKGAASYFSSVVREAAYSPKRGVPDVTSAILSQSAPLGKGVNLVNTSVMLAGSCCTIAMFVVIVIPLLVKKAPPGGGGLGTNQYATPASEAAVSLTVFWLIQYLFFKYGLLEYYRRLANTMNFATGLAENRVAEQPFIPATARDPAKTSLILLAPFMLSVVGSIAFMSAKVISPRRATLVACTAALSGITEIIVYGFIKGGGAIPIGHLVKMASSASTAVSLIEGGASSGAVNAAITRDYFGDVSGYTGYGVMKFLGMIIRSKKDFLAPSGQLQRDSNPDWAACVVGLLGAALMFLAPLTALLAFGTRPTTAVNAVYVALLVASYAVYIKYADYTTVMLGVSCVGGSRWACGEYNKRRGG